MNAIVRYFDLRIQPPKGELREGKREHKTLSYHIRRFLSNIVIYHLLMYLGVVLGVLGQAIFLSYADKKNQSAPSLIIGCIIAAVIFPKVSRETGIDPENPHPLHFFLAFQGGFFWQTIIGQIGKSIS